MFFPTGLDSLQWEPGAQTIDDYQLSGSAPSISTQGTTPSLDFFFYDTYSVPVISHDPPFNVLMLHTF